MKSESVEAEILRLQHHTLSLQRQLDEWEQVALLGQTAYALSGLVEAYVYQGARTGGGGPLSLSRLADKHSANSLQWPQAERWDHAMSVLSSSGMTVQNLIKIDKSLRRYGCEPAHGSWHQQAEASLKSLIQWADTHIPNYAVSELKTYIEGPCTFSSNNKPLCPDRTIV